MKLQVVRFQFGKDATNGMLFIDGEFECYTLEDEYRDVKVMGETCIPEGTYDVGSEKKVGFIVDIVLNIKMHTTECYMYKMFLTSSSF